MSTKIKRTRLLMTLSAGIILTAGTVVAIMLARGYRPGGKDRIFQGTGLLSATSYPKNANVFINDRLTSVTDDTLNLTPGEYEVKIIRTGFQPWVKTLPIKSELVTTTDARLFPAIPSTTPLTFYQVDNSIISPDGSKLAYVLTGSPFNQDNGLYVLSLSGNLLLGSQITQIADQVIYDYTKAKLLWSPDGSQILAVFADNKKIIGSHLLSPRSMNQAKSLIDTTIRLSRLLTSWQEQAALINQNNLARFPELIADIATNSAVNVYFSPDREKLLYTPIEDRELPEKLLQTNLPSINPTKQTRKLLVGKTYVYDLKEDSNFEITSAQYDPSTATKLITPSFISPVETPTKLQAAPANELALTLSQIKLLRGQYDPLTTHNLIWYPTNRHLVTTSPEGVSIVEYDNNNPTPIFSANTIDNLALPSPDGSRLIILTNFNQKPDGKNLLSIDLK